jgi:hypothetical protein
VKNHGQMHSRLRRSLESARRSSLPHSALILVAGLAASAFAYSFSNSDYSSSNTHQRHFKEGVRIHVPRSSPAFAAMEEALLDDQVPHSPSVLNETAADGKDSTVVEYLEAGKKPLFVQHPTITLKLSEFGITKEQLARELLRPLLRSLIISRGPQRDLSKFSLQIPQLIQKDFESSNSAKFDSNTTEARDLTSPKTNGVLLQGESGSLIGRRKIAGLIEFSGGLALTSPSDKIVVFRENENREMESASVWLHEGRYEVFVDRPEGNLVAELRSSRGEVVGRGEFALENLTVPIAIGYPKSDRVNLKISPLPQGITGVVASANELGTVSQNSYFTSKSVAKNPDLSKTHIEFLDVPLQFMDVQAQRDGKFEESKIIDGSSVIIRAMQPGVKWASLGYATAGSGNRLNLYSEKVLRSITKITGADTGGMLIGRVLYKGQPLVGAKVELLTIADNIKPIYFKSESTPEKNMTVTGENGMYAFFPVSAGAHAVQASIAAGPESEPRLIMAENDTASEVNIEIIPSHSAKVRVFDAFKTDNLLSASLMRPGSDEQIKIDVSGKSIIHFAPGSEPHFIDLSSGPTYERIRLLVNRNNKMINAPMIQSLWLERLRGMLRINHELRTGTVVGFIHGPGSYHVSLDETALGPNSRIIYFDRQGEPLLGNYGQPDGGFVVFNVAEGFRTLTVEPIEVQGSATRRAYVATHYIESNLTSVINHSIH